jgi:P pilus assembly chaperone PapD
MRRFASFVLALLFALSFPAYALGQSLNGATAVSAIELAISGQRLIQVGGALKLNATLTNRSAAPVAISSVHDGWGGQQLQLVDHRFIGSHPSAAVRRSSVHGVLAEWPRA